MHILAGQSQTFQNQTISEPIRNDGELIIIDCVVNGEITGTGNLTAKGGSTFNKSVTQNNITVG